MESFHPGFGLGDGFKGALLDSAGFCWVLLVSVRFSWAGASVACCRILLSSVGFCWVLLCSVGFCWILLGSGGFWWILLVYREFWWVLNFASFPFKHIQFGPFSGWIGSPGTFGSIWLLRLACCLRASAGAPARALAGAWLLFNTIQCCSVLFNAMQF